MRFPALPAPPLWQSKFELKPGSWVFVPTSQASEFGLYLKTHLERIWPCPSYYYHMKEGGHVKALRSHIHHKYFLHADIKNFFGCINRSRVTRCLKRYYSWEMARELAKVSTVGIFEETNIKYRLPYGFVQSPILASIALNFSKMGRFLADLDMHREITVSVYVDDIIISCDDFLMLKSIDNILHESAKKSGFPLNQIKHEGPSSKITSFNVHLSNNELWISESRIKKFKELYILGNNNVRGGIMGYIKSVNPLQSLDYHLGSR